MTNKKLTRSLDRKLIAGVCAGIAERYGWDVTIVRLLTVLSILIPGPQVLIYIVLWLVIPADNGTVVTTTSTDSES